MTGPAHLLGPWSVLNAAYDRQAHCEHRWKHYPGSAEYPAHDYCEVCHLRSDQPSPLRREIFRAPGLVAL